MRLPKLLPSAITGIIVVSLGVILGVSYYSIRELVLEGIRYSALLEVRYQSSKIDQWLALQKSAVMTLANRPEVKSTSWSQMGSVLELEMERLSDEFHHAFFVQPDGRYYFTNIGLVANKNLSDRSFFQRAIAGQIVVSDPLISRATGIPKINIAVPVSRGSGGRPDGVLAAGVKIDRLQDTISQLKYGPESYAFAVNADGKIIAHPDSSLMFNRDRPQSPLDPKVDVISDMAIAQTVLQGEAGVDLVTLDGSAQYIAHFPLSNTAWFVALVIPRKNIDSQLRPLDVIAFLSGIQKNYGSKRVTASLSRISARPVV